MMLYVLTFLTFLVTLGLVISGAYFLVEAPASRKKMRTRLAAIEESAVQPLDDPEGSLLRQELFSQIPAFQRLFVQMPLASKLHIFIEQAGMKITVAMLLMISFSLAFFVILVGLVLFFPFLAVILVAAGAAALPFMVIGFKRQRRFSKFEEIFPDAIDMLARAVRAGHAFTTGLELMAKEMPDPLASEFRITYEQQNFGMPMKEALHNLSVRMPLPDVRFFISALQIQREAGGNLAEILTNLAQVIRERFKILRQVRVFTAQGRMTMYILTALPPAFGLIVYFANPNYIAPLFTDPMGRQGLFWGVVLQVIGFVLIRRIIRIKV
jgi:tight adherence protein B